MSAIEVDEHCSFRRGTVKWVTVIVDLTRRPARLLDIVPGRSADVFTTRLDAEPDEFRAGIKHVAMDGFTGYKKAATASWPDALTVMDPFHVVALDGEKPDEARRRLQTEIHGRCGRTGDPLYGIRKSIRARVRLLTDKQKGRLKAVFADERDSALVVCWQLYQGTIRAYENGKKDGR